MTKTAVILFNLGGPDCPTAVRPFLFNLFNDPAILRIPAPFRQLLAWLISSRRYKKAQEIYRKMGGRSPILPNTQVQAEALNQTLKTIEPFRQIKCFIAMRYWKPFVTEAMEAVRKYDPNEIILVPLYPQYSTTTSASSLKSWHTAAPIMGLDKIPTKALCCFPTERGFIAALAALIRPAFDKASTYGNPRILFSAHGLPEKIVKSGDPYPWQCERTADALVRELNISSLDWKLCYQSRVGPLAWIGPATDDEVRAAGQEKKPLVIVPIAFVSEHSETLVELGMEYCKLALESGVPHYECVPTVSVMRAFIDGLAHLVQRACIDPQVCTSQDGKRLCPQEFSGCACV